MADNVAITAGSGTSIATDDEGGVHYQKVKLIASADGSTAPLSRAEDAAHASGDHGIMLLGVRNDANAALSGTDADYTPFSTDSAGNVNVKPRYDLVRIAVDSSGLTIATTSYTAGDQLGTIFSLASAARASGGSGMIRSVIATGADWDNGVVVFTVEEADSELLTAMTRVQIEIEVDDAGDQLTWVSLPCMSIAVGTLV